MEEPGPRKAGTDIKERLSTRLSRPLPGAAAQNLMAPPDRILPGEAFENPEARRSAVLLLITREMELVFIRRADNGGRHSGQIAFPGGIREEEDTGPEDTALRETEEEIGIPPSRVEIAGCLSRIYIPITRISVQPIIAWLEGPPLFRPEPDEIDEVLRFPINRLFQGRTEARVKRHFGDGNVPCFRIGETVIWGATAMITSEFLFVWKDVVPGAEGI